MIERYKPYSRTKNYKGRRVREYIVCKLKDTVVTAAILRGVPEKKITRITDPRIESWEVLKRHFLNRSGAAYTGFYIDMLIDHVRKLNQQGESQ